MGFGSYDKDFADDTGQSQTVFGEVTLAATTLAVIRKTVYTEQTSNAQRSIVSSSANDASAGTGARTVKLYYLDSSGAAFTETLTLNGTSAVNTVGTNICYIQKMEVLTVGSTGSNVGILSLKTTTAGGGSTFASIAATDNETLWAHHYIPANTTLYLQAIGACQEGTANGSGAIFMFKYQSLAANSAERRVTETLRVFGLDGTHVRPFSSPISLTGLARLTAYAMPDSGGSNVYHASFDYLEL